MSRPRLLVARARAGQRLISPRSPSSDRATAEQKAEADAAYKTALAAVVAAETGETPTWAPAVEIADAEPEAANEPEAPSEDPPEADAAPTELDPAATEPDTADQ